MIDSIFFLFKVQLHVTRWVCLRCRDHLGIFLKLSHTSDFFLLVQNSSSVPDLRKTPKKKLFLYRVCIERSLKNKI